MIKVNLCKPATHAGDKPADLVGKLVNIRPYYHVPDGGACLRSVRSPWAFEARVIETFASEMVKVRFTWETNSAPWQAEAIFFPRELHRYWGQCQCPACAPMGDGIPALRGA